MEKFKGSEKNYRMIFTALQNTVIFHSLSWFMRQKFEGKFGHLCYQKTAISCVSLSPLIDYSNGLIMNSCNNFNVIHGYFFNFLGKMFHLAVLQYII